MTALADRGRLDLFPLEPNKLHAIAGALRIGNYTGRRRSTSTRSSVTRRIFPSRRGSDELPRLSPSRRFEGSRLQVEAGVRPRRAGSLGRRQCAHRRLRRHQAPPYMPWTRSWCRRGTCSEKLRLDIPLQKTAQGGQAELTRRTFRCVCVTALHPPCSRCPARPTRRCSGWCSTRRASRPPTSTSPAGLG